MGRPHPVTQALAISSSAVPNTQLVERERERERESETEGNPRAMLTSSLPAQGAGPDRCRGPVVAILRTHEEDPRAAGSVIQPMAAAVVGCHGPEID